MRKLLLAAALIVPQIAYADSLVEETGPSSITIARDGENYRVVNTGRRYQTNVLPSAAAENALLYQLLEIDQRQVSVEGPQTEQSFEEATARITAYPLSPAGKGPAAYTIEGKADAVHAQNAFLTLTRYGCCIEVPTHAVYSLETGKYLFNATGDGQSGQWATMGAQGGAAFERIFAYHAKFTAADAELFGDVPYGAAIIAYASETEPLQRVMLLGAQEAMDHEAPLEWIPKLDLVSAAYPDGTDRIFVERSGKAAELFTGATLRLTLDTATVIEIPLVADRLDLAGAKLPAGYSLEEMKP
jgi:hypothetical protein